MDYSVCNEQVKHGHTNHLASEPYRRFCRKKRSFDAYFRVGKVEVRGDLLWKHPGLGIIELEPPTGTMNNK